MNIQVQTEESTKFMQVMGHQYAEGFKPAFNRELQCKGVVSEDGKFHMTLPLNGHRSRNLAEEVLGVRDASEWTIGRTLAIPLKNLQELPGFDQKYYDALNALEALLVTVVVIRVVHYDPGYGRHILVIPPLTTDALAKIIF